MQVSKQKVNKILDGEILQIFNQLIADIKTPDEAGRIFRDLLSEAEVTAVMKRLAIAYWLTKKRSYEVIKNNLKVSSATIATVHQDLKKPGWQMAIKKVLAEEWATKWDEKLRKLIKRSS